MLKKLIRRIKKYDLFDEILDDISFGFSSIFSILVSLFISALLGTIFDKYINIIFVFLLTSTFLLFIYLQFIETYKSKIKAIYDELLGLKSIGLNLNSDYENLFKGFGIENTTMINGMKVLLTIKIEDEASFYYSHSEIMELYQPCIIEVFSEYGEIYKKECYIDVTKDMIKDKSLLIAQIIKYNIDGIKESIENKKSSLNKLKEIEDIMKGVD